MLKKLELSHRDQRKIFKQTKSCPNMATAVGNKANLSSQFIPSRINSTDYIQVVENSLLPSVGCYRVVSLDFQLYNDSLITVMKWVDFWPPCSPDLSPTEYFFDIIVRNNFQYDNTDELGAAIIIGGFNWSESFEEFDWNDKKNIIWLWKSQCCICLLLMSNKTRYQRENVYFWIFSEIG